MKKLCLITLLLMSSFCSSLALADIKVGVAADMDISLVAQIDRYNLVLGNSGFAVDYIIKTGVFDNQTPLTWYVSGGGWTGWDDGFGVRAPAGISWIFAKDWDLYGQVQPVINFDDKAKVSVDGAIGVRFAF